MSEKIDLSIIFVGYNTAKYVEECMNMVINFTNNIKAEIFFVDNASPTKDYKIVEEKFPQVKLIKSDKNTGFAGGNNIAMKKAKGRYTLLLNLDIKITNKNIFKEMVDWMDKNPKVGISSCAFLNSDGTLQGNGGYFPNLFRVFFWMTFLDDLPLLDKLIKPYHPMHSWSFYKGSGYYKKERIQDWVTGAYFLIRKEVIDNIGYLDEEYFSYVEEMDYCFRTVKSGWINMYLPRWNITHFGQVSAGSEYALLSEYKNLCLFYQKHMKGWKLPFLKLLLKLGAILRIVVFGLIKGQKVANIYAKAYKSI
ncbi:MAG: glycosyltransferase family 2 protein [Patescibacteria group bacterium]